MTQRKWWVRGVVLGSALLLAPVGAWADKLTELEQAFETQQKSLQQLQQEMQRLRQERSAQQVETDRRVMEVEKKAAEAAESSFQVGFDPWPGKGFFIKSADGQHRVSIGGYIQTLAQVEGALGDPSEFSGGTITASQLARHNPSTFKLHRVRVIFNGQIFKDFGFHIETHVADGPTANAGSATRLEWAVASYTYAPWAKVTVGQMRNHYSLEGGMATQDLDFAAQRSLVVKALAPDLQLGVLVSGNLKLLDVLPFYYGVGIFNGCGRLDQCNSVDNDGNKEYTGRFTFAPPVPFGNLTIGLNADYRDFENNRGGARDLATNPVVGTNYHIYNPTSVTGVPLAGNGIGGTQNGFRINGQRVTGGGDLVYDLYPFIIKGEYHYATQERLALPGVGDLDNLIMQGGYGTLGYWVFGNKRGGLLAMGRYEHLRVDDRTGSFTSATATERPLEVRAGTLGLTWHINPNVFLRGNYILTDIRPGGNAAGLSNSTHGELAHQGIAELMLRF